MNRRFGRRFGSWAVCAVATCAVACGGPTKGARVGGSEAAACATPETLYGSCTMEIPNKGVYCADLTGAEFEKPESAEVYCGKMRATYANNRCPKDGVVARCLVMCGQPTESINTYYFGDSSEWQKSCSGTLLK